MSQSWLMMPKIGRIMSKRDDKYKLDDYIEFDEGFFESVDNKDPKQKKRSWE
jgi:hypothetical protein